MKPAFAKLLVASIFVFTAASLSGQDWAKAALEKSPRHREYVPLKHGDRTVQAFVVYPEVSNKAPVIVLIHEIFGLSDWAKLMADELAAKGYIVVAPDLLTGAGPNGGGTDAFSGQDQVTKAISGLSSEQVTADLDAATDYAKGLPAANRKIYVAGFCWGGGKTFAYATHRHDLSGAFVFYGPPPQAADMKMITAPVYGFYAGNDARITSTVPATTEAMKAAGKQYEPVIYDGAGHGFMRAGQAPDANEPNKKAYEQGLQRMLMVLGGGGGSSASSTFLQEPASVGDHQSNPQIALVAMPITGPRGSIAAGSTMDCHDPTQTTPDQMAVLMKK